MHQIHSRSWYFAPQRWESQKAELEAGLTKKLENIDGENWATQQHIDENTYSTIEVGRDFVQGFVRVYLKAHAIGEGDFAPTKNKTIDVANYLSEQFRQAYTSKK